MGSSFSRAARQTVPKRTTAPSQVTADVGGTSATGQSSAIRPSSAVDRGMVDPGKDPELDKMLSQLDGSISRHTVKVFDEETERRLAKAKKLRKQMREARLEGRLSTTEYRALLKLPEVGQGQIRKASVKELSKRVGVEEDLLWSVLQHTRFPTIVKHPEGYLVGTSWKAQDRG
ncbi:hypothetical protein BSKO_01676 [Bryopsis sp. KO-2023]|nr:hypothetical protein BSKO_01676 [Bryopsis sp. KO-2023]